MIARDSRRRASDILQITDELTAFEFEAVMSYLLQCYDNKREAARLKLQLQGIAIILGADPAKFPPEEDVEDDDDDVL